MYWRYNSKAATPLAVPNPVSSLAFELVMWSINRREATLRSTRKSRGMNNEVDQMPKPNPYVFPSATGLPHPRTRVHHPEVRVPMLA
jgi:hypothetical protein